MIYFLLAHLWSPQALVIGPIWLINRSDSR